MISAETDFVKYWICIALILGGTLSSHLCAQVIRGYVYENATSVPVTQADIYIIGEQGTVQLQSDAEGRFVFEPEYTGRFDIIVSHLGYELVHLQALQLTSVKDLILEIPMTARVTELTEVNVLAPSVRRIQNRFYTTSVEETTRFPGTFFDPARTATLFPGVFQSNDQANHLVVHGLSPALMQWYLEGVPVLNPNHLANAGTVSDRASVNGGGVNMLSNQVLATSSLVSGALPARYGNATSGVMDMQFRAGNTEKPEHTVQVGLLGLEVASEGRIKQESKASYLVNYRYSTIGLLSAFGVDFGDEKISFQDLNFNIHLPLNQPGAHVKFFGIAGLNKNRLEGPKDPEEREDVRDISDVDFSAGAVITGAAFQWPTRRGVIKAASVVSYNKSDRAESRLGEMPGLLPYSDDASRQTQISTRLEWQSPRTNRITLNTGISLINHWIRGSGAYPQSGAYTVDGQSVLFRPYGQVSYVLTGDVVIRGGLGVSVLSGKREEEEKFNTNVIPEPSLHIYWQAADKFSIESGYSYSGMTTPAVTYQQGSGLDPDLLRTHTFSFIFRNQLKPGMQLAGIMHYYAISHVPADSDSTSNHSILSEAGYPRTGGYTRDGRGRAISLALALRQDLQRGKFVRAGVGWVNSSHEGSAGILHSTAFDTGPWVFAASGKEWTAEKHYGTRVIGLNTGIHWRGGMLDQEIDPDQSMAAGYTVYANEGNFEVELENYFRIDLRLYLRKDKSNKSTTWSLDIQNLTSNENDFFSVYDPYLGHVRRTMQLGIVPVLSYRVDF